METLEKYKKIDISTMSKEELVDLKLDIKEELKTKKFIILINILTILNTSLLCGNIFISELLDKITKLENLNKSECINFITILVLALCADGVIDKTKSNLKEFTENKNEVKKILSIINNNIE